MVEVRAATAEAHARAELTLPLDGLSTIERYSAFLNATLSVVSGLEPLLERHLPRQIVAALDGPGNRIRHDLASVNAKVEAPATADAPGNFIQSEAAALGVSYVLIGSQLGGAVIARTLATSLGLGPENLTYLAPRDQPLGPRWKGFGGYVNAWGASATCADRDEFLLAALRTFAAFEAAYARLALTP